MTYMTRKMAFPPPLPSRMLEWEGEVQNTCFFSQFIARQRASESWENVFMSSTMYTVRLSVYLPVCFFVYVSVCLSGYLCSDYYSKLERVCPPGEGREKGKGEGDGGNPWAGSHGYYLLHLFTSLAYLTGFRSIGCSGLGLVFTGY